LEIKTSRKKGRYQSLKHEKNIQKNLYNENLRKFFGFRDSINLDDIFQKIKSDGLSNLDYQSISAEKISETSRKIKVKI
jgi:hypothetical protein